MQYSEEAIVAIVRAHPEVANEIEARDVVFRLEFDAQKRRAICPWFMLGREELQQEEFDLWGALAQKELSNDEAIEKMTDLMEQYYAERYPLR